jgi:hypothetical protein
MKRFASLAVALACSLSNTAVQAHGGSNHGGSSSSQKSSNSYCGTGSPKSQPIVNTIHPIVNTTSPTNTIKPIVSPVGTTNTIKPIINTTSTTTIVRDHRGTSTFSGIGSTTTTANSPIVRDHRGDATSSTMGTTGNGVSDKYGKGKSDGGRQTSTLDAAGEAVQGLGDALGDAAGAIGDLFGGPGFSGPPITK